MVDDVGAPARAWGARSLWLLYMPLLVPQVAFLFGVQVLLVQVHLDATLFAVVWAHLVFVLPYLFLSLADPWRAFDARYARSAMSLGASRWRVFWRIKLPILVQPVLIACAVAARRISSSSSGFWPRKIPRARNAGSTHAWSMAVFFSSCITHGGKRCTGSTTCALVMR